jgi:hypothetical protein
LGRPAGEKVNLNPHLSDVKPMGDPKSELELSSLHSAIPLLAPRMIKPMENHPIFMKTEKNGPV